MDEKIIRITRIDKELKKVLVEAHIEEMIGNLTPKCFAFCMEVEGKKYDVYYGNWPKTGEPVTIALRIDEKNMLEIYALKKGHVVQDNIC